MEIENMNNNTVMSYQGSAAQTVSSGQDAAAQPQAVEKKVAAQNLSVEKDAEETASVEEQGTLQSRQLKSAVNDLNKQMKNSEAIFGIHEKTNRVTIKIVDKSTKEVIKEYPPEQTLDMIAKVWEIAGILVDEKL